jgi:hypothetical protein
MRATSRIGIGCARGSAGPRRPSPVPANRAGPDPFGSGPDSSTGGGIDAGDRAPREAGGDDIAGPSSGPPGPRPGVAGAIRPYLNIDTVGGRSPLRRLERIAHGRRELEARPVSRQDREGVRLAGACGTVLSTARLARRAMAGVARGVKSGARGRDHRHGSSRSDMNLGPEHGGGRRLRGPSPAAYPLRLDAIEHNLHYQTLWRAGNETGPDFGCWSALQAPGHQFEDVGVNRRSAGPMARSAPLLGQFGEESIEAAAGLDEAHGRCRVGALVNERVAVLTNLMDSVPDRVGDRPAAPYGGQGIASQVPAGQPHAEPQQAQPAAAFVFASASSVRRPSRDNSRRPHFRAPASRSWRRLKAVEPRLPWLDDYRSC